MAPRRYTSPVEKPHKVPTEVCTVVFAKYLAKCAHLVAESPRTICTDINPLQEHPHDGIGGMRDRPHVPEAADLAWCRGNVELERGEEVSKLIADFDADTCARRELALPRARSHRDQAVAKGDVVSDCESLRGGCQWVRGEYVRERVCECDTPGHRTQRAESRRREFPRARMPSGLEP